jgi:hypothetical protein
MATLEVGCLPAKWLLSGLRIAAAIAGIGLVVATPPAAEAQPLQLGAQLGGSLSTFSGDGAGGLVEYRAGIVAGLTVSYRLTDRLRVESGAQWMDKGAKGWVQGFEEPISADLRLSYLQLPLVLRIASVHEFPVRPSLSVGSAVAYELRCRVEHAVGTLFALIDCAEEDRRKADVSFLIGMGLEWRAGRAAVLVEAGYQAGLRDLDRIDALQTRNRGWTLTPRISLWIGG